MDKKKVAVRTCAGCFCKFDRRQVIKTLSDAFADTCEFSFSYRMDEDCDFDLVLLINGCDSECAERSELVDNVTIDHNNWEHAVDVFAQEARARWVR